MQRSRPIISLFCVFLTAAFACGLLLHLSGVFAISELQTINQRFETRRWLLWSGESLSRLDLKTLWNYHEQHEMPPDIGNWDYTLSWLLQNNHPPVLHKVVIFNLDLEDEPPIDAAQEHPWMKPLLRYPISRATMADAVEFLARSGAKLIILDNDFPQYSDDDAKLATAMRTASSGQLAGKPVPVLMVTTISRSTTSNLVHLEISASPSGVLEELRRQEPDVDVLEKYTGTTVVMLDADQCVRRTLCWSPGQREQDSVVVQAMRKLQEPIPQDLPPIMDIDFGGPPESNLYPIRSFSYLLDPDCRSSMVKPPRNWDDVTLKDAIVILGDGVRDVHSTPYTNAGVNQMTGTEILAHAFDTIGRRSWPKRVQDWQAVLYLLACTSVSAIAFAAWKNLQNLLVLTGQQTRFITDLIFCVLAIGASYLTAAMLFAYAHLVVPVMVPAASIMFGFLSAGFWEREEKRIESLKHKMEAASERHRAKLEVQDAQSKAQQIIQDRERRREFIRRINHDLRAPVTALHWVLAPLLNQEGEAAKVSEKLKRLGAISDRMLDLISELSSSYEDDSPPIGIGELIEEETCNLRTILCQCVDVQKELAEQKNSKIELDSLAENLVARARPLGLSRAIDNVIRNALIHNNQGTTVKVSVESTDFLHTVIISDNGKGIEPHHLEHIFEPSYRGDSTDNTGEGLGLDIVRSTVESLNGQVSVYSTPGRGTTFMLSFQNRAKTGTIAGATDQAGSGGKETRTGLTAAKGSDTVRSMQALSPAVTQSKLVSVTARAGSRDTLTGITPLAKDRPGAEPAQTSTDDPPLRYTGLLRAEDQSIDDLDCTTTVLVGHDLEAIAEVARIARNCNVKVVGVCTTEEAIHHASCTRFDAIFIAANERTDIHNAVRLRDIEGDGAPIAIMVSDNKDFLETAEAAQAGVCLSLQRPLTIETFQSALEYLLAICPGGRPKILVVDDDEVFAQSLSALLRKQGSVVRTLTSSASALEHVRQFMPDLILLDVQMPELSGYDLCKLIRESGICPDVPVIFITADADLNARVKSFTSGGDDYIPKPVLVEELLARIKTRIDRSRLLTERSSRENMTGLLMRRAFSDQFNILLGEAERSDLTCCIALLDVDHFKSINDTHGHSTGDNVLIALAQLLQRRFRVDDLRGRWGGEEFILGFRDTTPAIMQEALTNVLNEFQQMIFTNEEGEHFRVSFSCGIACYPQDGSTLAELVSAADKRLYQAKKGGRKQVVSAQWRKPMLTAPED